MEKLQEQSAHRQNGWQAQYDRLIRWADRFKQIDLTEKDSKDKSHEYFDTMYACYQNIFILNDWLKEQGSLSKDDLKQFIKTNKEMGICRDICNGTKHYNLTSWSVDKEFAIISQYNQLSKQRNKPTWEIIICAGGEKYEPQLLIDKCIELWDVFISEKLNLAKHQ